MEEKKMEYIKLCDSDYRFMCVVWEHAPVNSGELVKLCQEQLGWKKSTTYTVVRKMCEKGYNGFCFNSKGTGAGRGIPLFCGPYI